MTAPLYSMETLRLAASLTQWPPLDDADARAERRSATCGSRVRIDVRTDDEGQIAAIGVQAQACALGQAAAAICAKQAVGRSVTDVEDAAQRWLDWLAGTDDTLDFWPGLEALAPARDYPARHPSMRLPFEALLAALTEAVSQANEDRRDRA